MARLRDTLANVIENFERKRTVGEFEITLPKPPAIYNIANHLTRTNMQMFEYTEQPKRGEEPSEEFLRQETDRIKNGYWFFNNGNLEWITGYHYVMLNYSYIDGQRPTFNDSQQMFFWIWDYCEKDPFCFGLCLTTSRRWGKGEVAIIIGYMRTIMQEYSHFGLQSKTGDDAKLLFAKLVQRWQRFPLFLKPTDAGDTNPKQELRFFEPSKRSSKGDVKEYKPALNSWIDFKPSTNSAYDGDKLRTYVMDEAAKCHGKGTKILMYDGSYKLVEKIKVGDIVMGDDSTPRTVIETFGGIGDMFRINPIANGWDSWTCSGEHLMSLKYANKNGANGWGRDEVINISVNDLYNLKKSTRAHLCLYRNQVEYNRKKVSLDPYILGQWLGDGNRSRASIASADKQSVDYYRQYCVDNDMKITVEPNNISYTFSSNRRGHGCNQMTNSLRQYNLLKNKHIPIDYLINDRETRLKLLAGLLDSDGTKDKRKNAYCIVQKNSRLALQIKKLVLELGFKACVSRPIAKMKRKDGSIYSCQVYRIRIYGLNLHEVPCLIERKKCVKVENPHKNTRDSTKTCFKVESIGVDRYYGFKTDKNSLYILRDCQVTHNCEKSDPYEMWEIVKFCLLNGSTIIGKALITTTVESGDVYEASVSYKQLWSDSNPNDRLPNGRTKSGLYRYYNAGYMGYLVFDQQTGETFIDKYGYSRQEFTKEYILKGREGLEGNQLSSQIRKLSLTVEEAFMSDGQNCYFNSMNIQEQMTWLQEYAPKGLVRTVTFYRQGDGKVAWRSDPNGKFQMVWDFPNPSMANKSKIINRLKAPDNEIFGSTGGDPYSASEMQNGVGSKGVFYVFKKDDGSADSGLPIIRYSDRPPRKSIFYDNCMLLCEYYGIKLNMESDIQDWREYYEQQGMENYLMRTPKSAIAPDRAHKKRLFGVKSKDPYSLQAQFDATHVYFEERCHKIYFIELLQDALVYDHKNRTKSDDTVAFGISLLGSMEHVKNMREPTTLKIFHNFTQKKTTPFRLP